MSWSPSDNVARAEAYLRAKLYLDPSNRLATVHERYRQTDETDRQTDRQRSDSLRRTVLQMVTQKPHVHISRNFLYMLPVALAQKSSDNDAICCVFSALWMTSMTSRFNTIGHI